ncbi:MAG: hypothetical protein C0425_08040 [Chlorobiaceae bacterium]|nr:hypothetical protein [Chlorobiaceae bacterium]MBA4310271.1 hypothetical protein [Chlorobiaceae bacterium]
MDKISVTLEYFKKKIKRLFDIFSFSLLVVPESSTSLVRSKKINSKKISLLFFFFFVSIFLVSFLFFKYTPANSMLGNVDREFSTSEEEMIHNLNQRVLTLLNELDQLKKSNENLRKAIELADPTLLNNKKDTPKVGGNVQRVFFDFIEKYFFDSENVIFHRPMQGFRSRGFEPTKGHFGIDYSAKEGTPIFATTNGYVIFSDYTVDDGFMIILAHAEGYLSFYKHCSQLLKKERDIVTQGEIIALSGNSGYQTSGPHLHFEIWKDGMPIDPEKILVKF